MKKKLILIGAGGFAKSVVDSIDENQYEIIGFIEELIDKSEHLGFPVISKDLESIENKEDYSYFVCIGNNLKRKRWFDNLNKYGLNIINVIDKSAIVSKRAVLGKGVFVGKTAIINAGSTVEDNCVVNTKALIEHGCYVHQHANLSTNSIINGDVVVGQGSFVGSSSVTIGQLKIGEWSIVGAGAVVTKNVDDEVVVAGIPAKLIRKNVKNEQD